MISPLSATVLVYMPVGGMPCIIAPPLIMLMMTAMLRYAGPMPLVSVPTTILAVVVPPSVSTMLMASVCITTSVLMASVTTAFLSLLAIIMSAALGPVLFLAMWPLRHLFFLQRRPPATLVPALFRFLSTVVLAVCLTTGAFFIPAVLQAGMPFDRASPIFCRLTGLIWAAVSVLPAGFVSVQQ